MGYGARGRGATAIQGKGVSEGQEAGAAAQAQSGAEGGSSPRAGCPARRSRVVHTRPQHGGGELAEFPKRRSIL